jgi:RHS repeat-associated protein
MGCLKQTYNHSEKPTFLGVWKNPESKSISGVGWYDFGARNYDPSLGMWFNVDPMAELEISNTPYNYCANNPVNYIDPNGMWKQHIDAWGGGLFDGNRSEGTGSGGHWEIHVIMLPEIKKTFSAKGKDDSSVSSDGMQPTGDYVPWIVTVWVEGSEGQNTVATSESVEGQGGVGSGGGSGTNSSSENTSSEAQSNGMSPFDVGVEWLTGTGPRHRDFTNGDAFTELLRQHDHVAATKAMIPQLIANGQLTGNNPYSLAGVQGVGKYIKDYSTLATGGLTGNLAVTYLGSYNLNWEVTSVNGNSATVLFNVTNSSSIQSATRPPVIGYTSWWRNSVGAWLNQSLSSGPMSTTTQTFNWTETITW